MSLMPDVWIRHMIKDMKMIQNATTKPTSLSSGVSSYGYDVRCAGKFLVCKDAGVYGNQGMILDPKKSNEFCFEEYVGDTCVIPPHSFALTHTIEYFMVPRDVLALCVGKSSYARIGVIVNVTPIEPAWEGQITLEISNTTPLPVRVYANEGIAQLLFFKADDTCLQSYKDKRGKYQGQTGITLPRLEWELS